MANIKILYNLIKINTKLTTKSKIKWVILNATSEFKASLHYNIHYFLRLFDHNHSKNSHILK